jgi:hypothetical protein
MILVPTQPQTEMGFKNLPGGNRQPVHKDDNLSAICELTVKKMWQPQYLTTL